MSALGWGWGAPPWKTTGLRGSAVYATEWTTPRAWLQLKGTKHICKTEASWDLGTSLVHRCLGPSGGHCKDTSTETSSPCPPPGMASCRAACSRLPTHAF